MEVAASLRVIAEHRGEVKSYARLYASHCLTVLLNRTTSFGLPTLSPSVVTTGRAYELVPRTAG